jgi:hypothetical protein
VNAMALAPRLDAPTLGYEQWLAVEETIAIADPFAARLSPAALR